MFSRCVFFSGMMAHVVGDLHEAGGCFAGSRKNRDPNAPHVYGMTASEIKAQYSFVDRLTGVDEKGWWKGGYEDVSESSRRALRVLEWLKVCCALCNPRGCRALRPTALSAPHPASSMAD